MRAKRLSIVTFFVVAGNRMNRGSLCSLLNRGSETVASSPTPPREAPPIAASSEGGMSAGEASGAHCERARGRPPHKMFFHHDDDG